LQNYGQRSQPSGADVGCTCAPDEAVGKRQCHARYTETGGSELLVEAVMFPETDELSYIFSNTAMVLFKRRLVDRVLRVWLESAREGKFPRREQIELSMLGEDQANCLVIAVQSPVEFSHFVSIGKTYHLRIAPTIVWQVCSCHICLRCSRNAVVS